MNSIYTLLSELKDNRDIARQQKSDVDFLYASCDKVIDILQNVDPSVARSIKPHIDNILDATSDLYECFDDQLDYEQAIDFVDTLSTLLEDYLSDDILLDIRLQYNIDLLDRYL